MLELSAAREPDLTPGYSNPVRAAAVLLAFCAVLAAGCGGGMEEATPTAPAEATTGTATNREPAPAIAGETLDGERIALADFRGKPVFVNVWSSW
jgi:cytochrome oxidase Cu insertion factor (SCO1/SenC/PrrC family)